MDKEEILEKSRQEQIDEGEVNALNTSRNLAFKIAGGLSVLFITFSLFVVKDRYAAHVVMAIFWCSYSTEYLYKYKFYKRKADMVGFISSLILGVGFGILAIMEVLWT